MKTLVGRLAVGQTFTELDGFGCVFEVTGRQGATIRSVYTEFGQRFLRTFEACTEVLAHTKGI